jgi:hypothetical protein
MERCPICHFVQVAPPAASHRTGCPALPAGDHAGIHLLVLLAGINHRAHWLPAAFSGFDVDELTAYREQLRRAAAITSHLLRSVQAELVLRGAPRTTTEELPRVIGVCRECNARAVLCAGLLPSHPDGIDAIDQRALDELRPFQPCPGSWNTPRELVEIEVPS